MEHDVTRGPSPRLERAVLWLVPPLVREEVAGDLCERYRGPLPYLAELIGTLPYLIANQARRGTDAALFALLAATLFVSLGGLEPDRGQGGVAVPLQALAAALPTLAVLWLRIAYRTAERWSGLRAAGDAAWLAIALALSQAVLAVMAPALTLPLGWLVGGFVFTAIVTALLRSGLELANTGLRPGAPAPEDAGEDYRAFRRNLRLRAAIESAALGLLGAVAAWFALTADRVPVSLVTGAWATLTLLLVAHRWLRADRTAESSPGTLGSYIAELKRQRAARGLAWWWYYSPLFAGIAFNTVTLGFVAARPGAAVVGLAACGVLAGLLVRAARRRRERLGEKIAQLERLLA